MADRERAPGAGGLPAATWLLVSGGVLTVLGLIGMVVPGPGLILLCPGIVLVIAGVVLRVTGGPGRT